MFLLYEKRPAHGDHSQCLARFHQYIPLVGVRFEISPDELSCLFPADVVENVSAVGIISESRARIEIFSRRLAFASMHVHGLGMILRALRAPSCCLYPAVLYQGLPILHHQQLHALHQSLQNYFSRVILPTGLPPPPSFTSLNRYERAAMAQ